MALKTKKSKKTVFLVSFAALLLVGAGAYAVINNREQAKTGLELREFAQGSRVNYKVIADGKIIKQNTEIVSQEGNLSLPLSPKIAKENKNKDIKYELDVYPPENQDQTPAEALHLLVNLDSKKKDLAVKASGLSEFAQVKIKDDKNESNLTADWAGIFSSNGLLGSKPNQERSSKEAIELAFQNIGIDADANAFTSGKVEVLFGVFGDGSGSSQAESMGKFGRAVRLATQELSAVMMMQTFIVGTFFDARIQLTTQRKHQELMARAHKDYHPSEQMCRIGTFMRNIAHTESKAEVNKYALNKIFLNQYLGVQNSAAAGSDNVNIPAKINNYIKKYCDPRDNGGALAAICENANITNAQEAARKNKDIDYTRTFSSPLTLTLDYTDSATSDDEEDIIALGKNLYFPDVFRFADSGSISRNLVPHYDSRSFAAKMGVAHASFVNIVGMKASAPVPPGDARKSGWAHMKALMREFGITNDAEITQLLGDRPSYYAQMEVLTKKIYQTPDFYTNLYDKPENIKRIGASIDAISLMNQRDRFESMLRREMISAVLVEEELRESVEDVTSQIEEAAQKPQVER